MLLNLLADKTREVGAGEAALYALLGFLMVFVGISFLILVVWLVGKIIVPKQPKPAVEKPKIIQQPKVVETVDEKIDEETLAVITAALMAYYQTNNPKCEFTLKRIKRI